MKKNLTLAIEETVLDRARVVAAQRKKTLTGMVRDFLEGISKEDREREESLIRLRKIMNSKPLNSGKRTWKREDLYDR